MCRTSQDQCLEPHDVCLDLRCLSTTVCCLVLNLAVTNPDSGAGLNSVVGKHLKLLLHGSPKSRRQMSNELKVGVLLSTAVSSVCLILTPNSH